MFGHRRGQESSPRTAIKYEPALQGRGTLRRCTLIEAARDTEPPKNNVALMRRIWGPLERGESQDFGPFFDVLAEDVVFETPVGQIQGRQALIHYYSRLSATLEFNPFVRPFEYYADEDRVVIIGAEIFKVKDSGVPHRAEWAWVVEVHVGRIVRIRHIQDFSRIARQVEEALSNARSDADEDARSERGAVP